MFDMRRFFLLGLFSLAVALRAGPAFGADAAEQGQLIAILQSGRPLAEKDAACARLKWIGNARCVLALSALLTDDQLSHSARYALESMPGPEVDSALLQALAKTSGSNEIGIINSLAVRREIQAVPALGKLLSDTDANAARAAAMALGRIGGLQAIHALEAAWTNSASGAVHDAEADGLLACANQLLTEGKDGAALKIFKRLYQTSHIEFMRQAAFRGLILASGRRGISLAADAIAGTDASSQGAALQVAAKLQGSDATKALANLLPKVDPAVQIALLACLDQREDPSALPAVAEMAASPDPDAAPCGH